MPGRQRKQQVRLGSAMAVLQDPQSYVSASQPGACTHTLPVLCCRWVRLETDRW